MRKHGSPKIITTDKLPSYGAAFCEIGVADRQFCGGRSNNRCENSHLPFRRRERAMQLFKTAAIDRLLADLGCLGDLKRLPCPLCYLVYAKIS